MVYDNGESVLGVVKDLRRYLTENCDESWEVEEMIEELKCFEDETIVMINYNGGMGYTMDWWIKENKVELKEEK